MTHLVPPEHVGEDTHSLNLTQMVPEMEETADFLDHHDSVSSPNLHILVNHQNNRNENKVQRVEYNRKKRHSYSNTRDVWQGVNGGKQINGHGPKTHKYRDYQRSSPNSCDTQESDCHQGFSITNSSNDSEDGPWIHGSQMIRQPRNNLGVKESGKIWVKRPGYHTPPLACSSVKTQRRHIAYDIV